MAVTVRVDDAGVLPLVADGLVQVGGRAVVEDGGGLTTYLPPPDDPEATIQEIRFLLRPLAAPAEIEVTWEWRPHAAWEELWRRGLGPRAVGERFVVVPSWVADEETPPGRLTIRLDPGIAFGTAEHGSTRGSLVLLESCVAPGDDVLDVGAGSGILSVAAALLGARRVRALEMDGWACEAARENVRRNGVAGTVEVREVRATSGGLREMGPVDGIAANIEAGVVTALLPGLAAALAPGGWLVASGIPEAEAPDVRDVASAAGFDSVGGVVDDGWWSGRFTRREAGAG